MTSFMRECFLSTQQCKPLNRYVTRWFQLLPCHVRWGGGEGGVCVVEGGDLILMTLQKCSETLSNLHVRTHVQIIVPHTSKHAFLSCTQKLKKWQNYIEHFFIPFTNITLQRISLDRMFAGTWNVARPSKRLLVRCEFHQAGMYSVCHLKTSFVIIKHHLTVSGLIFRHYIHQPPSPAPLNVLMPALGFH